MTWLYRHSPTRKHSTFLRKYKTKQFFSVQKILKEAMSSNARPPVWRIVLVTTNWFIMSDMLFDLGAIRSATPAHNDDAVLFVRTSIKSHLRVYRMVLREENLCTTSWSKQIAALLKFMNIPIFRWFSYQWCRLVCLALKVQYLFGKI